MPSSSKTIINKVPPDFYDRGIKKNPLQKLWHNKRFSLIKDLTGELKPKSILDIGCAGGLFTEKLSSFFPGAEITGVDIVEGSVAYARKKYPGLNFLAGDAMALPFPDGSFEAIFLLEILEHLEDPAAVLKEAKRCLHPGGTVVVLVPVSRLLFRLIWFLWTRSFGRVWRNAHLQEFTEHSIESLITASGYSVIERRHSHLRMLLALKMVAAPK